MSASKTLTPHPRPAPRSTGPDPSARPAGPASSARTGAEPARADAAGSAAPAPGGSFLRERPALHAEVWVYDRSLTHVVLVEHPWRGLVPPGAAVEPGETPREAALRAVVELTDLEPTLLDAPAAATTRAYRSGWAPTLCLAFAAVLGGRPELTSTSGHAAVWHPLTPLWSSWFPGDAQRIRTFARSLRG
ncbi:NUDIX domain-containing protein [Cellulomonas cellasea]|uniref:ADP-ribose pyrophosphatase YjhB (NUDIX family) n=1 Tax=Cellulomonas cellasea TaxID=43670 RepID=A0A7W4UFR6_9CELL|nr:NUDIX domain-containing protein [Cellulomonas cellasea]MBB2923312.1 ADP-ribose pyrophosphatase YjhB (NUDIX family) [Cellulomonas cellasea]